MNIIIIIIIIVIVIVIIIIVIVIVIIIIVIVIVIIIIVIVIIIIIIGIPKLYNSNLFCHIAVHSVVRLPFLFSSVNIEASTSAKVPVLILTLNVTTTC